MYQACWNVYFSQDLSQHLDLISYVSGSNGFKTSKEYEISMDKGSSFALTLPFEVFLDNFFFIKNLKILSTYTHCFYITFLICLLKAVCDEQLPNAIRIYSHKYIFILSIKKNIVKWKKHIFCKLLKYLSHDTIFSRYDGRALLRYSLL